MATVIDTPIIVSLSDLGEPTGFVWDRFEHTIYGQPQTVFRRESWWTGASSPARIDHEFWQVDAGRDTEHLTRYDLRHDGDGSWMLAVAWP